MSRRRAHFPRTGKWTGTICTDPADCERWFHPQLAPGDCCECCGTEIADAGAAQREETVTEDCHRCRHWTPAQRKWHLCIHCGGTGQVSAQREENTR